MIRRAEPHVSILGFIQCIIETMFKENGFDILFVGPPEYERLIAEIYYSGRFVALISQERGPGCFDLETPGPECTIESLLEHKVDWNEFKETVDRACQKLSAREPET